MSKKYLFLLAAILLFGSCNDELNRSLDFSNSNRSELEKVLEYFKNDSNPLKYKAAQFLIENMPYHHTYYGDRAKMYEDAYITMATDAKEFHDSVINRELDRIGRGILNTRSEVLMIKADYLIKAINDACNVWEKVNWNKDYDESLFLNYVLPYRLYNELISDWHETIRQEFPYLNAPVVYSEKGVRFPAFTEHVVNAKVIDAQNALKRKAVWIGKVGASVTFNIHSSITTQKLVRFRYSTLAKNTKVLIEVNGKLVGVFDFEPMNDIKLFRGSRFGKVVDLQKGENKITVKFANSPFILDYIEVAAYEPYFDKECENYSTSYCQIQNVGTKNYVSFDTLQSTIGHPITLKKYSAEDQTQKLRFDYLGYPSWKISPMENVDLCLQDHWASLDTMSIISKYKTIDREDEDIHYVYDVGYYQTKYVDHQKWVIIPINKDECKIMNKFSGLCWETIVDNNKEILVQNFYSGKPTQRWKICKVGTNPYAIQFFKIGSVLSEGLKVTDVMKQFEFEEHRGQISPSLASLVKYRTGNCPDETAYTIALSRYLGIPTAVDFTPHWGNRPLNHYWAALVLPNGKGTPFYMGYAPGDTAQFAHTYLKPKVYRFRYELNRDIVADLKGEKSVPPLFRYPKFTDVTDEYHPTSDVKRDIPKEYQNHDVAYICVNDKEEWVPVHYGKISWGSATFTKMGRNILYLVGVWGNGQIVPIGNPFILKSDGSVREIAYDKDKRQTMTLKRKYPFFAMFDAFNGRMDYGKFQGTNSVDFSKASILYMHRGVTEGCWYEAKLKPNNEKYKYLRYIGNIGSYCNVNEIEFYNSKGQKLEGKVIGTDGTEKKTKENVFDGDVLTGFNGISANDHWVGLELQHPSDVALIRYMPRNDGNSIEIGDYYELQMYDNGQWRTLGFRIAKDTKLVFRNIPSGGLFLLRDRTKGKEERIFTYENGKQVWW
ncbi:MAG: hypothetical protein Q4E48_02945 [Prevotella sp.]|nr:hypothetical protein [Prevotella sp.]